MRPLIYIGVLAISYLLGSIPSGLLIVKLTTGKDIRQIESGRTGGTNAMRAAGLWAGLLTAILDGLKAVAGVWLAHWLLPDAVWLETLSPVMAILGHNYSIFLAERTQDGKIHLRGGAGGAPCLGGSVGLWWPSIFFIVPLGALIFYFGGYASVTTMSVALLSTVIFTYRAIIGVSPWEYALYGVISFFILAWALKPNIRRLMNGTERMVGWRAKRHRPES